MPVGAVLTWAVPRDPEPRPGTGPWFPGTPTGAHGTERCRCVSATRAESGEAPAGGAAEAEIGTTQQTAAIANEAASRAPGMVRARPANCRRGCFGR